MVRARSCPSCHSIGPAKDGCTNLWHIEVRRPVTAASGSPPVAMAPIHPGASPERPVYSKVPHNEGGATARFMIVCDEGWRSSIICEGMYGDAADWLLGVLGHRPFQAGH